MFFVLFNTVINSFLSKFLLIFWKFVPMMIKALCLVRLPSFLLVVFSQAFWRKSGLKHKLKMLVYLLST